MISRPSQTSGIFQINKKPSVMQSSKKWYSTPGPMRDIHMTLSGLFLIYLGRCRSIVRINLSLKMPKLQRCKRISRIMKQKL